MRYRTIRPRLDEAYRGLGRSESGVDTAVGEDPLFSEFNGVLAAAIEASGVNSGVPEPGVSAPESLASPVSSVFGVNVLPHWGQTSARTRMDTPQKGQRRAISGSGIVGISNCRFRISDFMTSFFESSNC